VVRLAGNAPDLTRLSARVSVCRACPRLVDWREHVARERRAGFRDEPYWGRPIPGWGAPRPSIAIIGLAPAAHGGNRTGRIFTGDRSGDWLFAALHRAGLARQPSSVAAGDGQQLIDTWMLAAVRCAPPANKPTVDERDTCRPWLLTELRMLMPTVKVVVALGGFAWQVASGALSDIGYVATSRRPAFGHGAEHVLSGTDREVLLIASYHPSQQNTFTGKLTEAMLDAVFRRAVEWREAPTSA
jgi:uracil-DNA glycosylase family 4